MARHDFLDPSTGDALELVIDETPAGEHGVAHPDCPDLGIAVPHLDAWQCSTCNRVGRLDGAWALHLWQVEATISGGA